MALLQVNVFSECLLRTVTLNVVLPVGKLHMPDAPPDAQAPYKTLYLLHGIFGNYSDWAIGTRVTSWAMEKGLAVVMPSGDNHFYVDSPSGERFGEFIGVELPALCRKMFHLSDRYEDRYIAGLSMGGYGALRNGLKYLNTFSHVAGLSSGLILDTVLSSTDEGTGPFYTGSRKYYASVFGDLEKLSGSDMDYKALALNAKAQGELPKIYLACGTEDFLISQNRDYRDFLKENKIPATYEEGPGGHDWVFWDAYIKKVLDWLP